MPGVEAGEPPLQRRLGRAHHLVGDVHLEEGDLAAVALGVRERRHDGPGARPERPAAGELHGGGDGEARAGWRLVVVARGADLGQHRRVVPGADAVADLRLQHGGAAVDLEPERRPAHGVGVVQPLLAGDLLARLEIAERRGHLRLEPAHRGAQVVAHGHVEIGRRDRGQGIDPDAGRGGHRRGHLLPSARGGRAEPHAEGASLQHRCGHGAPPSRARPTAAVVRDWAQDRAWDGVAAMTGVTSGAWLGSAGGRSYLDRQEVSGTTRSTTRSTSMTRSPWTLAITTLAFTVACGRGERATPPPTRPPRSADAAAAAAADRPQQGRRIRGPRVHQVRRGARRLVRVQHQRLAPGQGRQRLHLAPQGRRHRRLAQVDRERRQRGEARRAQGTGAAGRHALGGRHHQRPRASTAAPARRSPASRSRAPSSSTTSPSAPTDCT